LSCVKKKKKKEKKRKKEKSIEGKRNQHNCLVRGVAWLS
jgi:hypothetical protein